MSDPAKGPGKGPAPETPGDQGEWYVDAFYRPEDHESYEATEHLTVQSGPFTCHEAAQDFAIALSGASPRFRGLKIYSAQSRRPLPNRLSGVN